MLALAVRLLYHHGHRVRARTHLLSALAEADADGGDADGRTEGMRGMGMGTTLRGEVPRSLVGRGKDERASAPNATRYLFKILLATLTESLARSLFFKGASTKHPRLLQDDSAVRIPGYQDRYGLHAACIHAARALACMHGKSHSDARGLRLSTLVSRRGNSTPAHAWTGHVLHWPALGYWPCTRIKCRPRAVPHIFRVRAGREGGGRATSALPSPHAVGSIFVGSSS
ncbi:hypothetical protein FB451DRAFT_1558165 [Mycena latifolia]|nr:hypothetical protein FB451DRAFT_1558165 [Mycena latifolia]